jgi:hypothetical protein
MKITGNKYFTKGKRTQQAVRAIARSGEKAVKLIGRGNNALSRIESRILQAAKTATHNPRVKISRAVRQTANALLNDPRLKILKPIAEKIRNASTEIKEKKQGYKINQPIVDALEFDRSVLGATDFLERHKIISPRQANKIRIAQRETTLNAPRKRDGIIPLDQKQREEVLDRAMYISRDIASRKDQKPSRQEQRLLRLRNEVDSKTQNNPLYDTSKKLQQTLNDLDGMSPTYKQIIRLRHGKVSESHARRLANNMQEHDYDYSPKYQRHEKDVTNTWIKARNRKEKVQQAYDTLGENYYNVRSALLQAKKLLSALKIVKPLRVKPK